MNKKKIYIEVRITYLIVSNEFPVKYKYFAVIWNDKVCKCMQNKFLCDFTYKLHFNTLSVLISPSSFTRIFFPHITVPFDFHYRKILQHPINGTIAPYTQTKLTHLTTTKKTTSTNN